MSWGTCYNSASNNIHFDQPPLMSSGNLYTSWQPEAIVNNKIREKENIKTNWEYRQYLTNNALQVMKYNTLEGCYELGLNPYSHTNNAKSNNVPFQFQSTHDTNVPTFGYNNSDLKNQYLSREQLQSRLISPALQLSPNK